MLSSANASSWRPCFCQKPGQARRGPQFPGFAPLALGNLDGPAETFLGRRLILRLGQHQFPLESMQFRFVKPLIVFLRQREGLAQRDARLRESTGPGTATRQKAQVKRNRQFGTGASVRFQSFLQQAKSRLHSALEQQTASGKQGARGVPEKKPLFRRDSHLLLGRRLRPHPESTMVEEPGRVMQRIFKAEGMLDSTRELEHLVVDPQRLVRKTEVPQGQRQIASMRHAGVLAHERGPERRALPIVEVGDRLRATVARPGKIAAIKPGQTL